jgi:uncharacterized protein with HEPN domain
MSKRPTHLLLNDICESIDRTQEYTEGMSLEDFSNHRMAIDAVTRNLEIMGEAANRLPDEFKEEHSDVEWYKIVGLRHRIVHEYFGVDLEIIWQILRKDLPQLRRSLSRL